MNLNDRQISLIRTIWELAQGRIDDLYAPEFAEQEKQAVEESMKEAFPDNCDDWVRAEDVRNNQGGVGHEDHRA